MSVISRAGLPKGRPTRLWRPDRERTQPPRPARKTPGPARETTPGRSGQRTLLPACGPWQAARAWRATPSPRRTARHGSTAHHRPASCTRQSNGPRQSRRAPLPARRQSARAPRDWRGAESERPAGSGRRGEGHVAPNKCVGRSDGRTVVGTRSTQTVRPVRLSYRPTASLPLANAAPRQGNPLGRR